ncbi:PadR family transcriptional regulator [Bacillus sp. 1P06AnD]|uniref:PadR family transcriptional regulator n=1 Tax=Bacillus sp. 1P06AnD TaxID=3132208 RepID=UPI00399F9847
MSIRLFILGTLASGNNHPYMIKKKLFDALPISIQREMSEGKFYYNFEALQKKGLIETVEVIHEKNRPDKTLYSITEAGKQALEHEIYESFKKISNVKDLYISIYLLDFVDTDKVALFFEETIEQEKEQWKQYAELKGPYEKCDPKAHFIIEHAFDKATFNIQWMEKLLAFIRSN